MIMSLFQRKISLKHVFLLLGGCSCSSLGFYIYSLDENANKTTKFVANVKRKLETTPTNYSLRFVSWSSSKLSTYGLFFPQDYIEKYLKESHCINGDKENGKISFGKVAENLRTYIFVALLASLMEEKDTESMKELDLWLSNRMNCAYFVECMAKCGDDRLAELYRKSSILRKHISTNLYNMVVSGMKWNVSPQHLKGFECLLESLQKPLTDNGRVARKDRLKAQIVCYYGILQSLDSCNNFKDKKTALRILWKNEEFLKLFDEAVRVEESGKIGANIFRNKEEKALLKERTNYAIKIARQLERMKSHGDACWELQRLNNVVKLLLSSDHDIETLRFLIDLCESPHFGYKYEQLLSIRTSLLELLQNGLQKALTERIDIDFGRLKLQLRLLSSLSSLTVREPSSDNLSSKVLYPMDALALTEYMDTYPEIEGFFEVESMFAGFLNDKQFETKLGWVDMALDLMENLDEQKKGHADTAIESKQYVINILANFLNYSRYQTDIIEAWTTVVLNKMIRESGRTSPLALIKNNKNFHKRGISKSSKLEENESNKDLLDIILLDESEQMSNSACDLGEITEFTFEQLNLAKILVYLLQNPKMHKIFYENGGCSIIRHIGERLWSNDQKLKNVLDETILENQVNLQMRVQIAKLIANVFGQRKGALESKIVDDLSSSFWIKWLLFFDQSKDAKLLSSTTRALMNMRAYFKRTKGNLDSAVYPEGINPLVPSYLEYMNIIADPRDTKNESLDLLPPVIIDSYQKELEIEALKWAIEKQEDKVNDDARKGSWQQMLKDIIAQSKTSNKRMAEQDVKLKDGDMDYDIVLIHGLLGCAFGTWVNRSNPMRDVPSYLNIADLWPRQWLLSDLNQQFPNASIRLLSISYDTTWYPSSKEPNDTLSNVAGYAHMLLDKMVAAGIGTRPVIFITHSMGGIILKEMLACAEDDDVNLGYSRILNQTKGIIYFSVPHAGSKFGDWSRLLGKRLIHPVIQDLANASSHLVALNEKCKALKGIHILSLGEAKPTRLPYLHIDSLIVSPESSNPGYGEYKLITDATHRSICKPTNKTDERYTLVRHFIGKLINDMEKEKGLEKGKDT